MADNVTLNPSTGTGSVVATKEVTFEGSTGRHVQAITLTAVGSSDTARLLTGTSSAGLQTLSTPSSNITVTPSSTMNVLAVASTGGFLVNVSSGTVSLSSDPNFTTAVSSSVVNLVALGSSGSRQVYLEASSSNGLEVNVKAGSLASNTEYTFGTDTYAETTNLGIMSGAVRNDTLAALANTDNEIAPLQVNAIGALYVSAIPSSQYTIKPSSTMNVLATASTGGYLVNISSGTVTLSSGVATSVSSSVPRTVGVSSGTIHLSSNATITPSSTMNVLATASTGGFTVNLSPSSGIRIVASSSNTQTVAVSSGTVHLSSNATVTPSSTMDVLATPSSAYNVAVLSGTVTATPSSAYDVTVLNSTGSINATVTPSSTMDVLATPSSNYTVSPSSTINVTPIATPSLGMTIFSSTDLDETEENCSTQACVLYDIAVTHTDTTPLYLSLFNASIDAVTVGTTAPTVQLLIPASTNGGGAGFTHSIPMGWKFSAALSCAVTTTAAGSAGPGAGECTIAMGIATSS